MTEKDIIMKFLSHISPNQITDFLGIEANSVWRLPEEIKDLQGMDFHTNVVLKTNNEIIQVELQQTMTRDTLNRFFVYNALLTRQFDKPVDTYIIYLGISIKEQVIETDCVSFKPEIIRVYDMDAKSVLEKVKNGKCNYIEMALMPLMKNSTEEEIVELVDEEVKMKIDKNIKNDIIATTLAMTSMSYSIWFVEMLKEKSGIDELKLPRRGVSF